MNMPIRYEKPVIQPLQGGLMNKYGTASSVQQRIRTEIDTVPISRLTEQFGSPLFVFSEQRIREKIRSARAAFQRHYPETTFAWSYKTNYLDAVASIFHQEKSMAEVVSILEYEKARRLGIPGESIIFNGPHKPIPASRRAASEGATINIDHFDEISDLEQVAGELGRVIPVGIRVNPDTGIEPRWGRFGFTLETGQAMDAVRRIRAGNGLRLCGLHCHIGTFILDPNAYRQAVEKLVRLKYEIETECGFQINSLDLGGGFPSESRLKALGITVNVPDLEHYAEAIGEGLAVALRPGDRPQLFLESGRALIDEAGFLITTCHARKRLPDGRRGYILDAGVNLLYTSTWYQPDIELEQEAYGMTEPAVLHGPLCMNIDVVGEGVMMPPLQRGARLVLSPVGAYNVCQSMQFIESRPAVVLITETGEAVLIREAEDLSDMVRREHLPAHLRRTA